MKLLIINNRTQAIKYSNLQLSNQIFWPIQTRKAQITEHKNKEKCETTRVEQRR